MMPHFKEVYLSLDSKYKWDTRSSFHFIMGCMGPSAINGDKHLMGGGQRFSDDST